MKQFILENIQIISASLNLLVILMYYLDYKYDWSSKQCKKEELNKFNVELEQMLDKLSKSDLKYNIFEDYSKNTGDYKAAYKIVKFSLTNRKYIKRVLKSPRAKYIVNQMLKLQK